MNLPQRHKEELFKEKESIEKCGTTSFQGGFVFINENYRDIIIEDIKVHYFTSMYPHIMMLLHEEELISIPEEYQKLKWFFENRDELKKLQNDEYTNWKYWVNSLYGNLNLPGRIRLKREDNHSVIGLISKYQKIIYKELLENNPENILYIDTDMILSVNPIDIVDCPLPYSTEVLTLGIIKEKKRYVVHDGYDLKVKGYHSKKHEEVKREIQSRIRQHQLEKLLIDK
jgi:hypothetical protein